jgi:hypothetical protein
MTGGEFAAGAAVVKGAVSLGASLAGDAAEKKQLSELAGDSKALEVAAHARADRVAIRQLALTKLFAPLARWVGYRSEYFANEFNTDLAEKLADVPEDQLVPPKPVIAAQAMEGLSYSLDEPALKDLYLNLLARVSDARTADMGHPSFAQVIKQLSPEEAGILLQVLETGPNGIPMVRIKFNDPMQGGYIILQNHLVRLVDLATGVEAENPQWPVWVENWVRLGLVSTDYLQARVGDAAYSWVDVRPEVTRARAGLPDADVGTIDWDKGLLIPTAFGLRFAAAVGPVGVMKLGDSGIPADHADPDLPISH